MKNRAKILLPLAVLAVGALVAAAIIRARPGVERQDAVVAPPLVRVVEVEIGDLALTVRSQGTVAPRIESVLIAQVAGRIEKTSASFAEGGFFRRGQLLIQIEDRDYRLAVAQAEAQVAQARVRVDLEEAEAALAREEWDELGQGDPSPLTLRQPQLAEAKAGLQAADASLERARLDLERTSIRPLFDGRVRSKQVGLGQFVGPGTPLGTVYSTDVAEIRLPVSKDQLAYLELPLGAQVDQDEGAPTVRLSADIAGRTFFWDARIVRTGSEFDPRTRMLPLFAEVPEPLGRPGENPENPLPMGLFVEAEIAGRLVSDVAILDRSALRDGDRVVVVDSESRLELRPVQVLRIQGDEVVVAGGLEAGELVCVSTLDIVVEGMRVRTVVEDPEEVGP